MIPFLIGFLTSLDAFLRSRCSLGLEIAALPGKKIGIRFQGYGGPGRRRSRREIPELEVTQDLFDDLRVFDDQLWHR